MTTPGARHTDSNRARQALSAVRGEVAKTVVGQDSAVAGILIALLCRGHILLEGVPGVAKTLLVRSVAAALAVDTKRVQFTPDLMPGDVTGSLVFDSATSEFTFREGPVFTNLLLADEINRTPPKTQASLLEAMEEHQVSIDGVPRVLPSPFLVAATQNPVEYEGTYPLPEAQLDRFLMEIDVEYPDRDAERKILFDTTGADQSVAKVAMTAETLITAQRLVRRLPVGDSVVEAILSLVRSARPGDDSGEIGKSIAWGPGPRASQALMLAVRARALLDGRLAPSIDDVLDLAEPVLKHRMALTFSARAEGETIPDIIKQLKSRIG